MSTYKYKRHSRAHAEQRRACRADAYIARVGLFAAAGHEEQVAKVIEITHVKEYHDEGERFANPGSHSVAT